jgi:hypothetical protein
MPEKNIGALGINIIIRSSGTKKPMGHRYYIWKAES